MNETRYHRANFHKHTFCIFTEVHPVTIATLKLDYKSKSGSCYYFANDGVYRLSNHWGRAANCRWRLENANAIKSDNKTKLGFAKWTEFHPDNETDKLYFIIADYEKQTAQFYHKDNANFTEEMVLRTSIETMKRIKQIRTLFEETAWLKYLKEEDVVILRKEIIQKLITTNATFQEIRKEYL